MLEKEKMPMRKEKAFYDYSVDATVVAKRKSGEKFFPVIETLHYDEKLKKYPFRPVVLGGDDLTVIIRGDLAIRFTMEFLKNSGF